MRMEKAMEKNQAMVKTKVVLVLAATVGEEEVGLQGKPDIAVHQRSC